jgi:hypothetical protein
MFKFKKVFEKKKVTAQKFKPFFITVDGVEHEGLSYGWFISNRLRCTVPEYIMIDIKSDGYIEDKDDVMYMLTNVISIRWEPLEERVVEDNFSEYAIFISTEELENNL